MVAGAAGGEKVTDSRTWCLWADLSEFSPMRWMGRRDDMIAMAKELRDARIVLRFPDGREETIGVVSQTCVKVMW